jgi:hypothetical protein
VPAQDDLGRRPALPLRDLRDDRVCERAPLRPSGLQHSVTMPCASWNARRSSRGSVGSSSIWLTSGATPVSARSRSRCAGVKLETPIARTRPEARSPIRPRQAST